MIIPLDDKTRIRGTETCWQLERKQKRNGVDDWKAYSYYTTFAGAVGAACQRELRTNPAHGVTEAIDACNRVTQKYAKIFDDVGLRVAVIQDTDLMANDQLAEAERIERQATA